MSVIFRLISSNGFGRVEVSVNGTFGDVKNIISKQLNIKPNELKLYADYEMTKLLNFPDSHPVNKLCLKQGDSIHVGNKPNTQDNSSNVNITTKVKEPENKEKSSVPWPTQVKTEKEVKVSELDKQREKLGLTPKCNHAPTSKCLHCMQAPAYKGNIKYNCKHGDNAKCPNCLDKDKIEDAKHISFDEFLNARKQKCKGSHDLNSKCNNCLPPLELSYKMKKNCSYHAPYPEGMCTKCIPPGVSLGRQVYRHIDYVSFMNIEEVNSFVAQWQNDHCLKQRMAYLFGYYAEDPNYPQGIRTVVEAIYEPPQIGDQHGVQALEDKDALIVDRIAAGLTLEIIGWMFTTIETDKETYMASYDIKKAAEFQEHYKLRHPSGYNVSKFITVMVKPKDDGNVELECCMISDTFQALVRDNIIGECVDKKVIPVRKAEKTEMLPDIFQENKKVSTFDPAFAIVQLSHGAPVTKNGFNILKVYDFPIATRVPSGILTEKNIKEYFAKKKKESAMNKYASFNFLIYLAKKLDIQTAENIGKQIAEEALDSEVIDSLVENIFDYY